MQVTFLNIISHDRNQETRKDGVEPEDPGSGRCQRARVWPRTPGFYQNDIGATTGTLLATDR